MVKIADFEKDRKETYERDDTGVRLVGQRTGKLLTVGDRVIVEVVDTSVARRQIDLFLVSILEA
jgi:ribonuclease R